MRSLLHSHIVCRGRSRKYNALHTVPSDELDRRGTEADYATVWVI